MNLSIFKALTGISLILQCVSCRQTPQNVVNEYYNKGEFNGAILVVKNNKMMCDTTLGFSNIEKKLKIDKNTSFYIASLSKSFTATAIMLLQQKGALHFDDKASQYVDLPDYAKNLSIRQLLNHTSGVTDYEPLFSKKGLTNQDVIHWLYSLKKLDFIPGSKFRYSNSGYIILSLIIEKISGETYKNFIHENIFIPLKMNNTYVYDLATVIQNKALGYNKNNELDDYSILTTGDGGIYSTPEDLYKFDQALRNFRMINKNNTKLMCTPARLSDGQQSKYGFAWFIEKKAVVHTGGLDGFKAVFWRDLQQNTCIIALTNEGDAFPLDDFLNDMKKAIQ